MQEPLPLAMIHDAVLEFLRGRYDAVVFGATAVNAHVDEQPMTQDIDIMSPRAAELAEELREYLNQKFHIAVRVSIIGEGKGYRLFQIQKPGNRHLVDLRFIETLPDARRIEDVLIISVTELIARKVISYNSRKGQPKSFSDMRDLAMLLLTFPELKNEEGVISETLRTIGANEEAINAWRELVAQEISLPNDEDEFD